MVCFSRTFENNCSSISQARCPSLPTNSIKALRELKPLMITREKSHLSYSLYFKIQDTANTTNPFSVAMADDKVDDCVQESANRVDLGNPFSNGLDGKKLLKNGDKAKQLGNPNAAETEACCCWSRCACIISADAATQSVLQYPQVSK